MSTKTVAGGVFMGTGLRVLERMIKFYLTLSPLSAAFAHCSWSQYGEDLIIASLLRTETSGFYVDVGAYHPFALSNTYYFYRQGWTGINIDPVPKAHEYLRRYRSRDVNVRAAVATERSTRTFVVNDVFSRLQSVAIADGQDSAKTIEVDTWPLAALLSSRGVSSVRFRSQPTLLTIDCEGSDLDVLRSNDWSEYPFRIVAVEDHSEAYPTSDIAAYMAAQGYVLRGRTRITSIFSKA